MVSIDEDKIADFLRFLADKSPFNFQYDDPREKISHSSPRQTLTQHIYRCIKVGLRLLDIHQKNNCISRLLVVLDCLSHDHLKLPSSWSVGGSKGNIRHSVLGGLSIYYILINYGDELERIIYDLVGDKLRECVSSELIKLLPYFTRIHHTSLKLIEPEFDLDYFRRVKSFLRVDLEDLRKGYKRYITSEVFELLRYEKEFDRKINLIDAYGLFKLSDILTSSLDDEGIESVLRDLTAGYLDLYSLRDKVVEIVKGKGRKFDESKFDLMRRISEDYVNLVFAAPTGWGKTYLAMVKTVIDNPARTFLIMPTITSIRDMSSLWSQVFGADRVGEYFYFHDVDALVDSDKDIEFYDLDRYFLRKINFTTIDQFLLAFLQAGKYFLRRPAFRNSLIVIDEFHLLNPVMFELVVEIIKRFRDIYRFRTLFMSATPDPIYVDHIKDSLGDDFKYLILRGEYGKLRRHRIKLHLDQDIEDFVNSGEFLKFVERGRVLIVVNTVEKAVKVFNHLKDSLGEEGEHGINLLHSRFTSFERKRREEEIRKARILVSTQVAEVSLDESFDTLITELAPIPSLIQRMGRVNRYSTATGPDFNVFVFSYDRTSHPYFVPLMDLAERNIDMFADKINRNGEAAIPEFFELPQIKKIHRRIFDISRRRAREVIYEIFERGGGNAFSVNEGGLNKVWRGCIDIRSNCPIPILAIPRELTDDYLREEEKLRKTIGYADRRRILASIKGRFLVNIPLYPSELERCLDFNHVFPIYTCDRFIYDSELGLIKG